jgi:dipeptidase D
MSDVFTGLKPENIWKHFAEILKISRCSGHEKAIGDHILSFAKSIKLSAQRDAVGNVLVRKPATPGHENAPGVVLQAHQDMVCEKNSDVVFDFSKDAIKPRLVDGWIQATGTTLGADNGIGISSCLALMEDASLVHGPLEFLFTVDEERGLTGANKIRPGFLKGRKLINLDSEEEGTFTVGCAGGADSEITLSIKRKKSVFKDPYRLKLTGYRGGHSGLDIHQGRGNAIKLLTRLVHMAGKKFKFELIRVEGGSKRNAIPREAWADFYINGSQAKKMLAFFEAGFNEIRNEYRAVETSAQFAFGRIEKEKELPLSIASQTQLLNLILGLPHGVLAMHQEIAGLVETSTNLAIVHCAKSRAQIFCCSRSSVASALGATRHMIKAVADLAGAKTVHPQGYPAWTPNLSSKLLQACKDLYKREFGQDVRVVAVHAGLECGIIGEKFEGMDMISFGPTMEHPHSPDERVHPGSVEKFWTFLTAVLREFA